MTERNTYYVLPHYRRFIYVHDSPCVLNQSDGQLVKCTEDLQHLLMYCASPRSFYEIHDFVSRRASEMTEEGTETLLKGLISESVLTTSANKLEAPPYARLKATGSDLLSITLIPTLRCNINCKYCYNKGVSIGEIDSERWKGVLQEIYRSDVTTLTITGGEPLLRTDVIESLDKSNFDSVTFGTNGLLLNEQNVYMLKEKVDHVALSIDSLDSEIHDINRGRGTHEKVIAAAELLSEAGVSWHANMVITNTNLHSISEMNQYVKSLGGERLSSSIEICNGLLDAEKYLGFLKSSPFYWESDRYPITRGSICGLGKSTGAIGPDGCLYPCHFFMLPEFRGDAVYKAGLKNAWEESDPLREIREIDFNNIETCRSCTYFGICKGGCRGIAYFRSKSLTGFAGDQACMMFKYQYERKIAQLYKEQYGIS